MDLTPDELAGVVDLFDSLTRSELTTAWEELAFKRGADIDSDAIDRAVDDAIASYHLVAVADHPADTDEPLLVVGPAAFPSLPDGAGDLPHIMTIPPRDVPESAVVAAAESRFRDDAVVAMKSDATGRIDTLLDVSYDLEAWGDVDIEGVRNRLDEA